MTGAERIECGLILITTGAVAVFSSALPDSLGLGRLLLTLSGLLLGQSLVRDLWLLFAARKRAAEAAEARQCMCVESTVGMIGILAGALALGLGFSRPMDLTAGSWSGLVFLTLAIGFVIKDWVFEWNPWRIRRDPDHVNIIVTFRK